MFLSPGGRHCALVCFGLASLAASVANEATGRLEAVDAALLTFPLSEEDKIKQTPDWIAFGSQNRFRASLGLEAFSQLGVGVVGLRNPTE